MCARGGKEALLAELRDRDKPKWCLEEGLCISPSIHCCLMVEAQPAEAAVNTAAKAHPA